MVLKDLTLGECRQYIFSFLKIWDAEVFKQSKIAAYCMCEEYDENVLCNARYGFSGNRRTLAARLTDENIDHIDYAFGIQKIRSLSAIGWKVLVSIPLLAVQ